MTIKLTDAQIALEDLVTQAATGEGRDSAQVLAELDAPVEDKVAVAESLGGPGAGEQWRAVHAR